MTPYEEEVLAWRERRLARLTAPDGWLAVTGLAWLHEGENTVGSDPSNDVVLPQGPPSAGVVRVEADEVIASFASDAGVMGDDVPATEVRLRDDTTDDPTILRLGTLTFHLIRRGDRLGVRIRDTEHPRRHGFPGLGYFDIDPRWRIEAAFLPYEPGRKVDILTVLDVVETYDVPGVLEFRAPDGTPLRLEALLQQPDDDLFVIFGDRTNNRETFGGGRYMYTPQADERGIAVLDFNRSYNPPCVFTDHVTCPLVPPQNRLPIDVRAGEKSFARADV